MRLQSSSEIAAVIAVVFTGLTSVAGLIFFGIDAWIKILVLSLVLGGAAFVVSWLVVRKYIRRRLQGLSKLMRQPSSGLGAQLPETLDQAEQQVQRWVESKAIELARFQQQESYQKEFLGNIAHELKTPIFNIQGYILTLLEGGLEDERINMDYLGRAEKSVERLIQIVNDLEGMNKFESGQLTLKLERIDLVNLVNEAIEDQTYRAGKRNIELRFDRNYSQPVWAFCDPVRITQVVTNLMVNSIKYGREGGYIEFGFTDVEDHVLVEITDNGIGIEERDLSRIFERFFRVEKSRARHKGGSGLGLSIVKHIIDAHNQTIVVKSEIDKGTTFSFTLAKR